MGYKQLFTVGMIAVNLFLGSSAAHALLASVPQTGQTASYASGDDGALKPGVAWPVPRFTDNSNGTVTDNLTGLIWMKNANCYGLIDWVNAVSYASGQTSGSCDLNDGSAAADWRLPTIKELQSLVDRAKFNPALSLGHPFSSVQSTYWSSTTNAGATDSAWGITMSGGYVESAVKESSFYVWPVRGGLFGNAVSLVSPSSKEFGDLTIGGTSSQTFTISNTAAGGSSNLQINAIAVREIDPGQYLIDTGNGSGGTCGSTTPILAPGASCTISVTFAPLRLGLKTATLRVSGSDATAPNADIPLTGTGTGFRATGSVSGGNGTISSTNPMDVAAGATASFTLAPDATYQPSATVAGTCPAGSFNNYTYTTGAITADCTVGFSFAKITFPLMVTFLGTGGGTVAVTPNPPAIDCTGTCSQSIDIGTQITLAPAADGASVFSGWSGCPSLNGNQCTVTMSAARSVSAFFNLTAGESVKANGSTFGTVSSGHASVQEGGEVAVKSGAFYEVLSFDRSITFTLRGGYNESFTAVSGSTAIHGALTIAAGTVIVDGITLM